MKKHKKKFQVSFSARLAAAEREIAKLCRAMDSIPEQLNHNHDEAVATARQEAVFRSRYVPPVETAKGRM